MNALNTVNTAITALETAVHAYNTNDKANALELRNEALNEVNKVIALQINFDLSLAKTNRELFDALNRYEDYLKFLNEEHQMYLDALKSKTPYIG